MKISILQTWLPKTGVQKSYQIHKDSTAISFTPHECCSTVNRWSALPACISPESHSSRTISNVTDCWPNWRSRSLEIPLLATQKQGEHRPGWIPAVVVWRLWKMTRRSNIRWRIMTEPWATGLSSVMLQSTASCLAMHVLGSFKSTQMNLLPMLYKRIAPLT